MSANIKWPIVRLATLAVEGKGAIVGGPFGSDLVSRDYVASGVPVIRGGNLPMDAKFSFKDIVFVSESKADSLRLNCAVAGDLVFTQRGTLGQVGLIPKNTPYARFLISQSQMKMTVDQLKADPLYLYHYFRLPSTISNIENHALQAGVPHINLSILRKFDVICPPLATQRKIAAILAAYDDLIENNQRRMALLEKMAEELYREWFVRLRFPGHEQVKFEKGLPEGWELRPYAELVEINPTERPDKNEEKPYFGMEHLSTSAMYCSSKERRTENSGSKFRNRDTLFPRITPCLENGKRGFVMTLGEAEVAIGSTEFIVMREKILTAEYIYLLCCQAPFRKHAEISMVGASGRQRVSEGCFSFFLIKTPPKNILDSFSEIIKPIFEQIRLLNNKNDTLRDARNMLLPRLISGKLPVDALDIHFPPSMQDPMPDLNN